MSMTVLSPGLLTTVQDFGRVGYQQYGVPVSGAVDLRAMSIANILVGNSENEAVLECTLLGPKIRFESANVIAVAGGDLTPMLDGKAIANYAAIRVEAGQILSFGGIRTGCRAYIAFAGGMAIDPVMGSRSTYMKAKIGGFDGRKLTAGDVIRFRHPNPCLRGLSIRNLSPEFVPRSEYLIRVVLGPQDDLFTEQGLHDFLHETYTVTPEFDRMGCRLDGPPIEHRGNSADIISDGIAFGAVQVPSSGKPIIMLADRQTTGGYSKIAAVISADFRILAQLKGGDKVRFCSVPIEEAQAALLSQRAALKALRAAVNRIDT